jgi:hypothetical protein
MRAVRAAAASSMSSGLKPFSRGQRCERNTPAVVHGHGRGHLCLSRTVKMSIQASRMRSRPTSYTKSSTNRMSRLLAGAGEPRLDMLFEHVALILLDLDPHRREDMAPRHTVQHGNRPHRCSGISCEHACRADDRVARPGRRGGSSQMPRTCRRGAAQAPRETGPPHPRAPDRDRSRTNGAATRRST